MILPYLPDGFFLWTLFKFGAPFVRFSRVLDSPKKEENQDLGLGGVTPEPAFNLILQKVDWSYALTSLCRWWL